MRTSTISARELRKSAPPPTAPFPVNKSIGAHRADAYSDAGYTDKHVLFLSNLLRSDLRSGAIPKFWRHRNGQTGDQLPVMADGLQVLRVQLMARP